MAQGMMTRKCKLALVTVLFFSICFSPVFSAQQSNWIIGAQKFSLTGSQNENVSEGIAVMFPSRILEKLSENLYRSIQENEQAERELYKLRQDRNSLFLQLSSAVKKRDSLVLGKYSQSELNRKLEEENKKIDQIKLKLSDNSARQKELYAVLEQLEPEKSSATQNSSFLVNLFSNDKKSVNEKIALYNNDISALFNPSQKAIDEGFTGKQFEKEAVNAKINCLITGHITLLDEYVSVTVETYLYPGCRLINSVTDFGSIDDADLIASNITRQLAPAITNSMPVEIKINVLTDLPDKSLNTYIDDVLYKNTDQAFTIDSGVHFIQFTAEGYKNAGTQYYFEGNQSYEIKVELEEVEPSLVFIVPKSIFEGDFLVNGKSAAKLSDGKSKITINEKSVLGEFITEDKNTSFFYIPKKKLSTGALYTVNVKPMDSSEYIEKRRKSMYLSYSILVTSLIPTIAANGKFDDYKTLLSGDNAAKLSSSGNYNKVYKDYQLWNISSKVFSGISIACGIWFAYELYRYFNAANSVLPVDTKVRFDYEEPPEPQEPLESLEPQAPQEALENQ